MIHKTSIIDSKAKISSNVEIGPYCVIGPKVEIKNDTIIHSHVNISGKTKIGKGNSHSKTLKSLKYITPIKLSSPLRL